MSNTAKDMLYLANLEEGSEEHNLFRYVHLHRQVALRLVYLAALAGQTSCVVGYDYNPMETKMVDGLVKLLTEVDGFKVKKVQYEGPWRDGEVVLDLELSWGYHA